MTETARPLQLKNAGKLSLTFIGTGSAFSKKNYQTNLLVVKGEDHLLVDCGTRAPEALHALGLSVAQIGTFLITHSHADHIGGLEEVMLVNRYGPKRKPSIVISKEYQDLLWNSSLKGGAAFNEQHDGKYLAFEDFWNIVRPEPVAGDRRMSSCSVGGINLKIFRTMHIPDSTLTWEESAISYGIIIDDEILFTSDTRFDPQMLKEYDKRFKLKAIFHDCQLFPGGVHASIDELSELPASMKKRMYLVHYQDSADTQVERAKSLGFKGFAQQWQEYEF